MEKDIFEIALDRACEKVALSDNRYRLSGQKWKRVFIEEATYIINKTKNFNTNNKINIFKTLPKTSLGMEIFTIMESLKDMPPEKFKIFLDSQLASLYVACKPYPFKKKLKQKRINGRLEKTKTRVYYA